MSQPAEPRARKEVVQRIQVGLIGLLGVLMVVMLANIVINSARNDMAAAGQVQQMPTGADGTSNVAAATETEPLADLGVTPTSDTAVGTVAGPVGPAVPDLQPDPRLSKPMDRDPKSPQQSAQGTR